MKIRYPHAKKLINASTIATTATHFAVREAAGAFKIVVATMTEAIPVAKGTQTIIPSINATVARNS